MVCRNKVKVNLKKGASLRPGQGYTGLLEKMKAVLKYPGAKNRIANWICSYIPEHSVYLEPYAGSLAVLFNKPRSHIETINDIDCEVTNYFKVLRDSPEELRKLIELTPYSREEYRRSYEEADDSIEKARRFCIKCNF